MKSTIEAIRFATEVHREQTRKGKTEQYIIHPLTVGLILGRAGARDEQIVAGILHDTIEDCQPYGSITKDLLAKKFGGNVAEMVNDVTEQDKSLPWEVRKQQALEHIKDMGEGSLLVKSADTLHNLNDQLVDYAAEGDRMFEVFNAKKEAQLQRYQKLVKALRERWQDNPLLPELEAALQEAEEKWS